MLQVGFDKSFDVEQTVKLSNKHMIRTFFCACFLFSWSDVGYVMKQSISTNGTKRVEIDAPP